MMKHALFAFALVVSACSGSDPGNPFEPGGSTTTTSVPNTPTARPVTAADLSACIAENNKYRAIFGVPALTEDAGLDNFAMAGAKEDFTAGAHHHALTQGFSGGENEAQVESTVGDPWLRAIQPAVALWFNEGPAGGHYQNLLNPRWTRAGCGIASLGNGVWITVDYQ